MTFQLVTHLNESGEITPTRRVIGTLDMTPEFAADLNKLLYTTHIRVYPVAGSQTCTTCKP